jgi:hypothetical protein
MNFNTLTLTDKTVLFYIAVAFSDIAITAYGLWLGYGEGNPAFAWIRPEYMTIIIMVVLVPPFIYITEKLFEHWNIGKYLPHLFVFSGGYRFVVGTMSWSWLLVPWCIQVPSIELLTSALL